MAMLIEIDREPRQNDIIVFHNGKWRAVDRETFMYETNQRLVLMQNEINAEKARSAAIEEDIASMKEALHTFADGVNDTLNKHHDVLQVLVGGSK